MYFLQVFTAGRWCTLVTAADHCWGRCWPLLHHNQRRNCWCSSAWGTDCYYREWSWLICNGLTAIYHHADGPLDGRPDGQAGSGGNQWCLSCGSLSRHLQVGLDRLVDPVGVGGDPSVQAGQFGQGATDARGDDADDGNPRGDRIGDHQRRAAVAWRGEKGEFFRGDHLNQFSSVSPWQASWPPFSRPAQICVGRMAMLLPCCLYHVWQRPLSTSGSSSSWSVSADTPPALSLPQPATVARSKAVVFSSVGVGRQMGRMKGE